MLQKVLKKESLQIENLQTLSRGGRIRTLGTSFPVRQFSKLLVSAAHPSLLRVFKECKCMELDVIHKFLSKKYIII